jgi:hypothetical protein
MRTTSLFPALATAWQREFQAHKAFDRDSGELRARLLATVTRLTPLMALANLLNAAVVLILLDGVVPLLERMVWFTLLAALCASGLRSWWRHRGAAPARVSPRALRHAAVGSGLLGLVWAAMAAAWFPEAGHGQQMVIMCLVLGTMCGGAFALAPVPLAALAHVGTLGLGALVALLRSDGVGHPVLPVLLALYTAARSWRGCAPNARRRGRASWWACCCATSRNTRPTCCGNADRRAC